MCNNKEDKDVKSRFYMWRSIVSTGVLNVNCLMQKHTGINVWNTYRNLAKTCKLRFCKRQFCKRFWAAKHITQKIDGTYCQMMPTIIVEQLATFVAQNIIYSSRVRNLYQLGQNSKIYWRWTPWEKGWYTEYLVQIFVCIRRWNSHTKLRYLTAFWDLINMIALTFSL